MAISSVLSWWSSAPHSRRPRRRADDDDPVRLPEVFLSRLLDIRGRYGQPLLVFRVDAIRIVVKRRAVGEVDRHRQNALPAAYQGAPADRHTDPLHLLLGYRLGEELRDFFRDQPLGFLRRLARTHHR